MNILYGSLRFAQLLLVSFSRPNRLKSRVFSTARSWTLALLIRGLTSMFGADQDHIPLAKETGLSQQYLKTVWTGEEGLPGGIANSVVQTADGFIWVATFAGLARFDGLNFRVYDPMNTPELESERIVNLYLDREGRLWIGSEFGHVARFSADEAKQFSVTEGVPPGGLGMFVEDAQGVFWAAQQAERTNYYRLEDDRFVPASGKNSFVKRFGNKKGADGLRWYDDPDGINLTSGSDRKKYFLPPSFAPTRNSHVVAGRNDGAWLVSDRGIFRLRNEQWEIMTTNGPAYDSLAVGAEDDLGNLWIGDWRVGLTVYNAADSSVRPVVLNEGKPDGIRDIFVDRDGSVWVASDTRGLFRFKKRLFGSIDHQDGLASDVARSISGDRQGNVWVCTTGGVDRIRAENGKWAIQRHFKELELGWYVFAENPKSVWIGTYGKRLKFFDGANLKTRLEPELAGGDFALMTALFRDSRGTLWMGASQALYRIEGEKIEFVDLPGIGRTMNVRAFAETRDGSFFVGANGQGLFRFANGTWERIGPPHGLTSARVSALAADRNGALWIGTSGSGLFRYAGGRAHAVTDSTLPKTIIGIQEDDQNHLWLAGDGIWRASLRTLNANADARRSDVPNIRFDRGDGLPSSACVGGTQPSVYKGPDGRLWFPTMRGVALIDPKVLPQEQTAPVVQIEKATGDGVTLPLRMASGANSGFGRENWLDIEPVILAPGTEQLEFQFTSPEFLSPEKLRFRYRLEGHDTTWLEASSGREARYSRLAPGQYLFRVIAASPGGFFSGGGAAVSVVVQPFYWQTTWFACLVIVACGVLVLAGYRYSLWRQNEISRLRLRIASDLHDEVGSNLGSIALRTEMLQQHGDGAINRNDLEEINAVALRTVNDIRDVAWFINPDFDTLAEMGMRMREVAGRMLAGLDWTFEFTEGTDRKLTLEFRRNVFFIYKEVLHNIVRHSHARHVRICGLSDGSAFTLEVKDDGDGWRDSKSGGQGIRNMERRARELGGTIDLENAAGGGMIVRLHAPYRQPWFASYDK